MPAHTLTTGFKTRSQEPAVRRKNEPGRRVLKQVLKKRLSSRKPLVNIDRVFLKKFLLLFIFIFIILLFGLFLQNVRRSVWIPGTRLTVVVVAQEPMVVSYSPAKDELLFFKIPANTQLEAGYGLGRFFASSLKLLGEQKGLGEELVALSVSKTLGIPVDSWVETENKLLSYSFWLARGSLGAFDRVRLFWSSKGALIREISLADTGVISKEVLADGAKAWVVSSKKAEQVLGRMLRDEAVSKEGKSVALVNTTAQPGLAAKLARILSTLGVKVIKTEDSKQSVSNCILKGEKEHLESKTARKLLQLFNCDRESKKAASPAALEILLGEGFAERF